MLIRAGCFYSREASGPDFLDYCFGSRLAAWLGGRPYFFLKAREKPLREVNPTASATSLTVMSEVSSRPFVIAAV